MNQFKIKRKRERDQVTIVRFLMLYGIILGVLLTLGIWAGGRLFTFKHVLLFSIGAIPLSIIAGNGNWVWNNVAYATSGAAFAIGPQGTVYSEGNVVFNNIFAGDGTHTYAITVADTSTGPNNYIDYNCSIINTQLY